MRKPGQGILILLGLVLLVLAFLWTHFTDEPSETLRSIAPGEAELEVRARRHGPEDEPGTSESHAAEPAGVETEDVEEASFSVLVLDEEGAPVPEALVQYFVQRNIWETTPAPSTKRSAADGRAIFAFRGLGSIVASSAGHFPALAQVEKSSSMEVVLERGETITGYVTVDGEVPKESLELGFYLVHPDEESQVARLSRLPDRSTVKALRETSVATDPETGRFQVAGLPPGWRLDVSFPRPLGLAGGSDRYQFSRQSFGGSELELQLVAQSHIKGRVIDLQGNPVAAVTLDLWRQKMPHVPIDRVTTSDDGCFCFIFNPTWQVPDRIDFSLGAVLWSRDIDMKSETALNLGDVVVPAERLVTIHVRDAANHLPLAFASLCRLGMRTVLRTDTTGTLSLLCAAGEVEFEVAAPGHEARRLSVPASVEDTLTVDLEPSTKLLVECRDREGQVVGGAMVYVEGRQALVADLSPERRWVLASTFQADSSMSWSSNGIAISGYADAEGRAEIWGIQPGLDFKVGCRVPGIASLAEIDSLCLAPGEERRILLQAERGIHPLLVEVRDRNSEPIPAAIIKLYPSSLDGYLERTTNSAGQVRFRALADEKSKIEVLKQGYANLETEVMPGSEVEPLILGLSDAPEIDLWFRSSSGAIIDAHTCYSRGPGTQGFVPARRLEAGHFRISVPSGQNFKLQVGVGLDHFEFLVDLEKGSSQTFTIPDQAEFEITLDDPNLEPSDFLFRVKLADGSAPGLPFDKEGRVRSKLSPGTYSCWIESRNVAQREASPSRKELRLTTNSVIRLSFP